VKTRSPNHHLSIRGVDRAFGGLGGKIGGFDDDTAFRWLAIDVGWMVMSTALMLKMVQQIRGVTSLFLKGLFTTGCLTLGHWVEDGNPRNYGKLRLRERPDGFLALSYVYREICF